MWKSLLKQSKTRASNSPCLLLTIAGLITVIVYLSFAGNSSLNSRHWFATLIFITGVLCAIASYKWCKQAQHRILQTCCQYYCFDLRGHRKTPDCCPECGRTPTPLTESDMYRIANKLSLIPGVLLLLSAIFCLLFTLLYLVLFNIGAYS